MAASAARRKAAAGTAPRGNVIGLALAALLVQGRRGRRREPAEIDETRDGFRLAGDRALRGRVFVLAALEGVARRLGRRRRDEFCSDSVRSLAVRGAVDLPRLWRARLVRPDRPRPSRPAPVLGLHFADLVHHLRAVAQHRRLGVLRRGGALSRLFDQGARHGGSRPARRLLLVHLLPRHGAARRSGADVRAGNRRSAGSMRRIGRPG